jgi:tRNA(adenine34) deaminase
MVARAHDRVQESNDPTAHAVVVALRETARKLGTDRLASATIFATLEPCAMCVGALLQSDVEALVYAVPNTHDGAPGTVIQLAQHSGAGAAGQDRQRASAATRPRSCSPPPGAVR